MARVPLRSARLAGMLIIMAIASLLVPGHAGAAGNPAVLKVLVMGDSYSAGNGAGSYSGAAGCYRSTKNYAQLYVNQVISKFGQNATLNNVACSGATWWDFFLSKSGRPPERDAVDSSYDLILLTMGGNDIGFSSIVSSCLVKMTMYPAKCDKYLSAAEALLSNGTERQNLTAVLSAVSNRSDARAKIVLLGYPYLEGDPNFVTPTLGLGGVENVRAGARVRALGDAGDTLQQSVVNALNAKLGYTKFVFVKTKALFEGPPNHAGRATGDRTADIIGSDVSIRRVSI